MALDKQVAIYSIDTSAFYTYYEEFYVRKKYEFGIYKKMIDAQNMYSKITSKFKSYEKSLDDKDKTNDIKRQRLMFALRMAKRRLDLYNDIYNKNTAKCKFILNGGEIKVKKDLIYHQDGILEAVKNQSVNTREIRRDKISDKDGVSIFDSSLTRQLGLKTGKRIDDSLFIVRIYYFHILKDLMDNGYYYNGEKYIFFGCSAGQIRQKKAVFIKESLYKEHEKTIMCGLTIDEINNRDGMNVNKFMAYTSLINSATEVWEGFDIDKAVVVEDFETPYEDWVDYITYEEEEIDGKIYPPFSIVRRKMQVDIPHTDGFGIMLENNTTMVRLPFIKGLMSCTPYDTFIRQTKKRGKKWFKSKGYDYDNFGKVKDIYGKEYDILEDGIKYIFTKSQFKMWKYYDSWEQYKTYFKQYGCEACTCNEEEEEIKDARINYQMLQTLSDATNEELQILAKETNDEIVNSVRDRETMLKTMGVTKELERGTYLQQALKIYPELLADDFLKDTLKQNKASLVKQARSGRLRIDGKYTFVCPDIYAFMEWLFLGEKNPKGLLNTGEVSCSLYDNGIKLDCLRSPHLSIEHSIKKNVVNNRTKKWYKSKSIYTSTRDMITKMLQLDCDGDRLLVVQDKTLIDIAERNVATYNIVPLFYNMKKANAEILTNESLLKGLKDAYVGGNIGIDSNKISKCLNNMRPTTRDMTKKKYYETLSTNRRIMKCVKLLCMHNNFEIDYAKCLFSIEFDDETNEMIKEYTNQKLPHFFKFAKDKEDEGVENRNYSTVNRLYGVIKNPKLIFKATNLGTFDYTKLMKNPDIEVDENVISTFEYLKRNKKRLMKEHRDGKYKEYYIDSYIRNKLLDTGFSEEEIVDMLVKYCQENKMVNKNILWNSFGDIVLENIKQNVPQNTKLCDVCGERFEYNTDAKTPKLYCDKCSVEVDRKKSLERWKNNRKNQASK